MQCIVLILILLGLSPCFLCVSKKERDLSFLYSYLTPDTDGHSFNESIKIGFLGAYGTSQVALGALPLAVTAVNADPTLLPGRNLTYMAADIGTTEQAIRKMTEMRDNGIIAFIGPDDTCRSEALVAAAWNLPMISYGSSVKFCS
ncbi:hypothetical protein M8J75_000230 [Diaphorina citri]|nr:hypothetical protein M8J75_000230 [Diaphorina citri]